MASLRLKPAFTLGLAPAIAVMAAALVICASGLRGQNATQATPSAQAPPRPVLVELFTSEGCSDCPPADELLARLDQMQSIPGVQPIVLSEHVTYWNREGWHDPFSFDAIDERQHEYARQFTLNDVYTPQMVVDGTDQFVGNDAAKLIGALTHAATVTKLDLKIEDAHRAADGSVDFSVQVPAGTKANLVAAVAESAATTQVGRGENAGRTLHHVAVVRVLKDFGSKATDGRPLQLSGAGLSGAQPDGTPLRLVVFLVNHGNGHVVGAAEQTLGQ
jgi:hypothetical protein